MMLLMAVAVRQEARMAQVAQVAQVQTNLVRAVVAGEVPLLGQVALAQEVLVVLLVAVAVAVALLQVLDHLSQVLAVLALEV
jgi:hypothetical protein